LFVGTLWCLCMMIEARYGVTIACLGCLVHVGEHSCCSVFAQVHMFRWVVELIRVTIVVLCGLGTDCFGLMSSYLLDWGLMMLFLLRISAGVGVLRSRLFCERRLHNREKKNQTECGIEDGSSFGITRSIPQRGRLCDASALNDSQ